ncbi:hypothetical protein G7Z17_g2163 [Cylindrodendrum hubeiense]|uniref:Uncharacterized protein n=1 Tax=Cylindrodendrum hubeiense TaxID=595255 RepID=A0A9P5HK78_9HYPO|nr:hypothetical protein G7Z17_g2163 [Cylindrodendrum hubeiense]
MEQDTSISACLESPRAGESRNDRDADMGTSASSRGSESDLGGVFLFDEQRQATALLTGGHVSSHERLSSSPDALGAEPFGQPYVSRGEVDLHASDLEDPITNLPSPREPTSSSIEGPGLLTYSLPDGTKSQGRKLIDPPKSGPRFPAWVVRALKDWFADHIQHPYPTPREMETIQRQTGLSRQQIANWLANTRRRTKSKRPRAPSPFVGLRKSYANIDMTDPHGSPMSFQHMDPLQRWQNSPPEHEAVDASALAQAIYGLSPDGQSLQRSRNEDRDATTSWHNDLSASSAGTSFSSRSSLTSAYSHASHNSRRSFEHPNKSSKRRRRRITASRSIRTAGLSNLAQTSHTFQCTFCTETFKTKHSWQRHEKSLHLSLERSTCSPGGPTIKDPKTSKLACVYCAQLDPDEEHLQGHNCTACFGRLPEERTFYRKDHIQQHLKLVHNATFISWPMDLWKDESEVIRSRCGFCDFVMSHWTDRVDHLAAHFKEGKSMKDWQGDWGFENHMLDMVENAMPPYLIDYERNSPCPFTTMQGHPGTPSNAFELIKLELEYLITEHLNKNQSMPSDESLRYESCCIVVSSDVLSNGAETTAPSWLRDLLTSSESTAKRARLRPMRDPSRSWVTQLKIHGKGNIFEKCTMEDQLQNYVEISKILGNQVEDCDLQFEAHNIVARMEASSPHPCAWVQPFLSGLIYGSSGWLTSFRHRANLGSMSPSSTPRLDESSEMSDVLVTDSNHSSQPICLGMLPSDSVSKNPVNPCINTVNDSVPAIDSSHDGAKAFAKAMPLLLNDDNCYRGLVKDLSRFVVSTISRRNPDSHVPTNEELQYQARWIMFQE